MITNKYQMLKRTVAWSHRIFKGLKMTFITKILKKIYHVNQYQKYYILCFDNFSSRLFSKPTFLFLATLLFAVNFTKRAASIILSDAPTAQDNALSA